MKIGISLLFVLIARLGFAGEQANAPTQSERTPNEVMPLIAIDDVRLTFVVQNLARVAGCNYIIDPDVTASFASFWSEFEREPIISKKWTNVTPENALTNILADHKLKLVKEPATTVARIVFANETVKPAAVTESGSNVAEVMPMILISDAQLHIAIRELARTAKLPIKVDPNLRATGSGFRTKTMSEVVVSFRWENLTARQAISALLDNYDLGLIPGTDSSPAKVVSKAQAEKVTAEKVAR